VILSELPLIQYHYRRTWEESPLGTKGKTGMIRTKSLDLFAGIPVADYAAALKWLRTTTGLSARILSPRQRGGVGTCGASVRVHCAATGTRRPRHEHPFVDDLDALVAQVADRGLDPAKREAYSNGVRNITYRDTDGNEIGFGGAPL
jgi:hypothetical protein